MKYLFMVVAALSLAAAPVLHTVRATEAPACCGCCSTGDCDCAKCTCCDCSQCPACSGK